MKDGDFHMNLILQTIKSMFRKVNVMINQLSNNVEIAQTNAVEAKALAEKQSDWNQNDETAPDYIKNKTHYEFEKREIILPETTLNFTQTGYGGIQQIPNIDNLNLMSDEEYIVTWDDVEYLCIAHSFSGEAIGNNGILTGTTDEGFNADARFFIWNSGIVMPYDIGEYTFKIEKAVKEVHKLDKKFLPPMTETPDWEQNDPTATDYIKNRTHYSKIDVIDTVLSSTTILVDDWNHNSYDDRDFYSYSFTGFTLNINKKYKVTWDNTEYILTPYGNEYDVYLGNDSIAGWYGSSSNTGEPFCLNYESEYGNSIVSIDGNQHTFSIEEVGVVTKTLDKKYLPEELRIVDTKVDADSTNLVQNKAIVDYTINGLVMRDQKTGHRYIVQIIDGTVVSSGYCTEIRVSDSYIKKDSYVDGELIEDIIIEGICEDGSTKIIENFICVADKLYNELKVTYTEAGNTYTTAYYIGDIIVDVETVLTDFTYNKNDDGTYTLTEWKGTYNGETSTRCIIPNSTLIRL